ncbi:hypothetical protein [Sinorhizobium meliloti]|uniref:hypothetical protein n=1 Tax=Rhizobium meliloti TaxID=382 RepID=UPI000310DE50|nr:hypothetical protein [Sinorhizobium meliloti]MDE4605044.1 hypothetical protein [Sinorhizobium meliloti]UDU21684.1 hypothetical protein LJD24_23710 [Sinorhizobium meliloti]
MLGVGQHDLEAPLSYILRDIPNEIIEPAAPHLWGETEAKAHLPMAAIKSLQAFDEETFEVFSLLNRPGKTRKSGRGNYAIRRAPPGGVKCKGKNGSRRF